MEPSPTSANFFTSSLLFKLFFSVCLAFSLAITTANAAGLDPAVQAKVDKYKQKLTSWAQDPEIITAIEKANQKNSSISNDRWKALGTRDAKVLSYQKSPAGKKLTTWNSDKALGKLFLRDKQGNLVAGSKKPAIFNIADRPAFAKAMSGKTWNSSKVKPDPTTQLSSIQVSAPVMNKNGKQIGVIHTSVIVK